MKCRPSLFKIQAAALAMIGVGLLLLLFCVPFWVFCCVLGAVLIVIGLKLFS